MPIIKTSEIPLVIKLPVVDDSGSKNLTIRFLNKDTLSAIRKKCLVRVLNKRTHQYDEEVDSEKWARLFCDEALSAFESLTWRDLNKLLEPGSMIETGDGEAPEVLDRQIPPSGPEYELAKDALLRHGKQSTLAAIIRTAGDDDFNEALQAQQDAEKKT